MQLASPSSADILHVPTLFGAWRYLKRFCFRHMTPKVTNTGRSATIKAPPMPRDARPVTRVSMEFLMRGVDALTEFEANVLDALVILTLLHAELMGETRHPIPVRHIARLLDVPYETVRRRARTLVVQGGCVAGEEGLVLPVGWQRRRPFLKLLRKLYIEGAHLLTDLASIGVAKRAVRTSRRQSAPDLDPDQMAIALAAASLLLAGSRALRRFWDDDLTRALVFTAIWTANVKHVTNTAPAANRGVLRDEQRLPVSRLAISRSLRLPYETVRRHANRLVRQGLCEHRGRRALVVPAQAHERLALGAVITHRLVLDFVDQVRRSGINI